MSSLAGNTISFEHVYLQATGNAVGPMEYQGPLGILFDHYIDDLYGGEKTFEKAERALAKTAIEQCLEKAEISTHELDLALGGDLLNQITTANFVARDLACPFIGMYGACASSALALLNGSLFVEAGMNHVLTFVASHQATAERQYRYPLEYGVQKKLTTTYTATGGASFLLGRQKSNVQITKATIGSVIDYGLKDPNDMGSAMAPAAFHALTSHFHNTQTKPQDYDLIVTGDLSTLGLRLLKEMFLTQQLDVSNLNDCGLLLYDTQSQPVFMGGSGCACSALVLSSFLYENLCNKKLQKILYAPTGALLSPTTTNQKETIPAISHVIQLEAVK